MKFPWFSNTLRYHQSGAWRPPKTYKIRSQEMSEIIKITKKTEKRHLMKTRLFTMFLRGWDIRNHQFFQSEIIKNHACYPNMLFDTSNHIKYEKVTENWSQRGTQKSPKIIKNPHWDIEDLFWMSPGTKWSPNWCHSDLSWTQNVQKWFHKTPKIYKFQCSKSAASRGPAAGAKPLNISHHIPKTIGKPPELPGLNVQTILQSGLSPIP